MSALQVQRTLAAAAVALAALGTLGGCATTREGAAGASAVAGAASGTAPVPKLSPKDPWEAWNRKVFAFNEGFDEAIAKPVARAYVQLPQTFRTGVSNAFGNVGDAWSAVNQLLQGKVQYGMEMTMRFLVNTVFGLGGVLDLSTDLGLERRSEDLGQTLGWWGVPSGPFVMLPFFGPSTVRDTAAMPADRYASLSSVFWNDGGTSAALTALNIVQTRAKYLTAGDVMSSIALDKYRFMRDGYLDMRRNEVYDGEAPREREEDEEDDAAPEAPAASASAPAAPASAASSARP